MAEAEIVKGFSGDTFLLAEVVELVAKYNFQLAIETGTYMGDTTRVLAKYFPAVITIESSPSYFAGVHFEEPNITKLLGESWNVLPRLLPAITSDTLFFLDAHWGNPTPTPKELDAIAEANLKPVIIIHDVQVPEHPEFGYDTYPDFTYNYDSIKPHLDKIYGSYTYRYNCQATGAMRGVMIVEPNQK